MKKLLRKLTAVVLAAVVAFVGVNFGGIGGLTVAAAETVGAFTVVGGTKDTDYSYADGVLTIKSVTPITIKNTDPSVSTTDRIEVASGVYADITLAGVNICTASLSDTAAFKIADNSTGNVTITIADGSENTLKSGADCAGLQKNGGGEDIGKLTIKGGTKGTGKLTATGDSYGNAAGIGGGYKGTGSNIEISGGTVTATSGSGAGIGGGSKGTGSKIKISGGTVTATGKYGAGIGGGYKGTGSNIEISGGTVTATGGDSGAGIGGSKGTGSNIEISGGTVTATGGNMGAGIGGGADGTGSKIKISGGTVTATGGRNGSGIGGAGDNVDFAGFGSDIEISGGTVTATGGNMGAGIGGGYKGTGSSITISGGTVTATGGSYGSGIGGGTVSDGSNIEISGGTVTATGGERGSGIGGGAGGSGSDITISGGSVKAVAGTDANDIGGGADKEAVTPTNGATPVYLFEIENEAGADITINNNVYPAEHTYYDFEGSQSVTEKKIYAYLPAKDSLSAPLVVKVGTKETKYIYGNSKWLIVPNVTAPTINDLVYTGGEQALVTEGTTSGGTMKYSLAGNGTYTAAIPIGTDAGTYTVWYKVEGGEDYADTEPASVEVTIAQAMPKITNADTVGNQSTVYGSGEFAAPDVDVTGTVTYKVGETTYTGEELKTFLADKNVNDSSIAVDYTFTPTDTTNYKEVTGRISFTIARAGSSIETAPKAKKNLTYNGSAQELVDAGTAAGGTMMYSTSQTGEYSANIPTGTDAEQYSVWYKVVGDANHTDTEPVEIKVTIKKAGSSVGTAPKAKENLTYDGTAQALVDAGTAVGGTMMYSTSQTGEYSANIPTGTDAEQYSVWYKVVGDANHTDTEPVEIKVTIKKAGSSVGTAPKAKENLTYDGTAQALVDAGTAVGGTMMYSTSQTGEYSANIPTGTDAEQHSVWYKVVGDANHSDTTPIEIKVTIAPLTITNENTTINLGTALTYTGAEQTQSIASVTVGTMTLGAGDYTISGDKGTNAGGYTLTVTGTGNFTGTATKDFSIGKKSLTGTGQTLLVKKNQAKDVTYDLGKLLPEGVIGTTVYAVGTVTNEKGVLSAAPTDTDITDGKLTLHVASVESADQTASVQITFTNSNYDISTATLTVKTTDKTPVSLSGVTCGSRVYNGTAYAYTGTPVWKTSEGESATGETTVTYYEVKNLDENITVYIPLQAAPTDAGSYRAEFTITSDYYVGTASYSFEITKAVITVAAKNKSIYVGDAVPDLTIPMVGTDYTVTGLCGTDALGGTAAMSYAQKPDNTKTGTYEILISGLTAPEGDNYTITFTNGTLTITTKPSSGDSTGGDSSSGGSSGGGSTGGGSSSGGSSGGGSTGGGSSSGGSSSGGSSSGGTSSGGSSSGGSSSGAAGEAADKPADSGNTTTTTNKDGSTTTTTTETDANGNNITTTTTVATDGSTTEKVQEAKTNAAGKEVEVTTTTKTDADGNVTGVTEKSVINHIEKNTTATVTVKTDGNVTSAKASITKTSDSSKVSLSGKVLDQITEAAGVDTKVRVTMTVKDSKGNTKYKVQADADEIVSGEKLYIYKLDTKTGKYTMVDAKEYKVTKAGTVTINMTKKATYELVTVQESKAITKEILATVKPAKNSTSLSKDKKTTFKLSAKLDMDNVKSVTYTTSKKSIAAINKKGTITAVKAGTATVKATITLKNGTKKTVKMTIKVN